MIESSPKRWPQNVVAAFSVLPRSRPAIQWAVLLVLSLGLSGALRWAGLPAALLIGPMLAAILFTVGGSSLKMPRPAFAVAQGIIGCLIAIILPAAFSGAATGGHVFLFAAGVVSVITVCAALGWCITQLRWLPGTTAVWGFSPGAATVMTLLAETNGADAQFVAVTQYLRVLVVAAVASVVANIWGAPVAPLAAPADVASSFAWWPCCGTVALAVAGPLLNCRLRIPAGALLLPLVFGLLLPRVGLLTLALPHWLLAVGYAVVGWRIGLRFTRPLLVHAAKALPRMLVCTLILIQCGVQFERGLHSREVGPWAKRQAQVDQTGVDRDRRHRCLRRTRALPDSRL